MLFLRLLFVAGLAGPAAAWAQPLVWLDKCTNGSFMGLDLAIDYCTRAIKSGELSNRNLGTAYHNRAMAYFKQGRLDLALRDYDETVRLDEIKGEPPHLRAITFFSRANIKMAKRDYDGALADFDESIRYDPRPGSTYVGRGQVWLAKRDADRALADFSSALKGDAQASTDKFGGGSVYSRRPKNFDRTDLDSSAYAGRGFAYVLKNDRTAAMVEFGEAIRIKPNYVPALKGRAQLAELRSDYAAAIADYTAALHENPRDAAGYYSRGRAWAALGEYAKSALDFDAALQVEPQHHAARMSRGFIAIGEGRYDDAAEQFARVQQGVQPRAYLLLWKHVAQARSADGQKRGEARDELARNSVKLVEQSMHAQIVAFYLGRSDDSALRKPGRNAAEGCEADYFLAQHHLIGGDKVRGAELLAAIARQCPATLQETWAARLELKRLEGSVR